MFAKHVKKRYVGCHSHCEEYLTAQKMNEEEKERKRKLNIIVGYTVESIKERNKNRRWRI